MKHSTFEYTMIAGRGQHVTGQNGSILVVISAEFCPECGLSDKNLIWALFGGYRPRFFARLGEALGKAIDAAKAVA